MRLFKGYVLSLLMLPGLALAETIGEVSTVFKWVGPVEGLGLAAHQLALVLQVLRQFIQK